jgi:hypothetical protein
MLLLARPLALRNAIDLGFNGLFLVDNRLRELAHEATTDILVDHGAWPEGVRDVAVGCVMMPVPV